jgi:gas vesicle structural protein
MAVSTPTSGPSGGALTEVLELILDRGVVIDVFVRVSLVGIEIVTIDARIVVASVDTYLRYAEAVGRLNLDSRKLGAQDLIAGNKTEKAIEAAKDQLGELFAGLSKPAEQVSQRAEQSSRLPDGKRLVHRRPARRAEPGE